MNRKKNNCGKRRWKVKNKPFISSIRGRLSEIFRDYILKATSWNHWNRYVWNFWHQTWVIIKI